MGAELHPSFLLAKARRGNGRGKGQLPSLCWLSRLSCLWSLLRSALLYITFLCYKDTGIPPDSHGPLTPSPTFL